MCIGIGSLIGNSIVLYFTFLSAFFNNYKILVTINEYSEAHFEFFFIPITFIIGVWTVHNLMKQKVKNVKE